MIYEKANTLCTFLCCFHSLYAYLFATLKPEGDQNTPNIQSCRVAYYIKKVYVGGLLGGLLHKKGLSPL